MKYMKTGIIAVIIAVALIAVGYFVLAEDGIIEDWTENNQVSGEWKKEVYLVSSDGSKHLISGGDGLRLEDPADGTTVSAIEINLQARATTPTDSDPYDNVEIDRSGTSITCAFGVNGGATYWSASSDFSGTVTGLVDGNWFTVYTTSFDLAAAEDSATNLPWTGGDTLWLNFAGDISFRGTTDGGYLGEWSTISGPTLPSLGLTYIGYGLDLEWQDDADWTPEETITCYQCDGYDAISDDFTGTECPSGWQSTEPDCGTPPTGVTVQVEDSTIATGSQGTVGVDVLNVADLVAGEVWVQYDPTYLTYITATGSGSGYTSHDATNNIVKIMPIFTSGGQDGTVNVGSITFERETTGNTELTFSQNDCYLSDSTDTDIPIESWVTGTIS